MRQKLDDKIVEPAMESGTRPVMSSTTNLLRVLGVLMCLVTLSGGACEKSGGSRLAGDAVKTLQQLKFLGHQLTSHAQGHDGAFPASLNDVSGVSDEMLATFAYRGRGVHVGQSPRVIIAHADVQRFAQVGIPTLWSDGEVVTVSEHELQKLLKSEPSHDPSTRDGS